MKRSRYEILSERIVGYAYHSEDWEYAEEVEEFLHPVYRKILRILKEGKHKVKSKRN